MIKYRFEKYETFVFYYNPESEIETITENLKNSDKKSFNIGYFVSNQNNGKLIWFEYNVYGYGI